MRRLLVAALVLVTLAGASDARAQSNVIFQGCVNQDPGDPNGACFTANQYLPGKDLGGGVFQYDIAFGGSYRTPQASDIISEVFLTFTTGETIRTSGFIPGVGVQYYWGGDIVADLQADSEISGGYFQYQLAGMAEPGTVVISRINGPLVTPEPATVALLATGLLGLGGLAARRRRHAR